MQVRFTNISLSCVLHTTTLLTHVRGPSGVASSGGHHKPFVHQSGSLEKMRVGLHWRGLGLIPLG